MKPMSVKKFFASSQGPKYICRPSYKTCDSSQHYPADDLWSIIYSNFVK